RVVAGLEVATDQGGRELYQLFFYNEPATTEIYTTTDTLSLHDALPILSAVYRMRGREGKRTRSRSISRALGLPSSCGSTAASSTGRVQMVARASSQSRACTTGNRGAAARRSLRH